MEKRIFLSPPHMNGTEMPLISEAFDSNWIAPLGPFVDRFERELGTYLDGRHVCALCSGTSALHLGLLTLGVGPGDRVYCSDFTFSASCNVIRYCGADPVFIDSEPASWQMDPDLLASKLEEDAKQGKLPKAIVVVDLYGISADFGRILPLCAQYGIPLLEDSAEALGSRRDGKLCGTFGKVSGFSFNGNKIITTSGGGALVSEDESIVKRARYLATQAREPKPFYHHVTIGYNYRLSNLLAAVGCGQLNALEQRVEARRAIFDNYVAALSDIEGIGFMPEPEGAISNKWLTVITIDPDKIRKSPEDIRQAMEAENIETRWAWKPMHMQPVYENSEFVGGDVCENIFNKALCLPSGSSLSGHEQDRVCECLRNVLLK
ncbi:MAG: aminotransferase class I/II-fold pyridoxal phosphate-dependent enzyme [Proteobacteria bacterium]|nr:aminotransferase class I/II-fold pyridoxal phosphate-dependent enzyme [Pseudomonadota bacterium]